MENLPEDIAEPLRDDEKLCEECHLAYFHNLPGCPDTDYHYPKEKA